jgi:hypothetical protein
MPHWFFYRLRRFLVAWQWYAQRAAFYTALPALLERFHAQVAQRSLAHQAKSNALVELLTEHLDSPQKPRRWALNSMRHHGRDKYLLPTWLALLRTVMPRTDWAMLSGIDALPAEQRPGAFTHMAETIQRQSRLYRDACKRWATGVALIGMAMAVDHLLAQSVLSQQSATPSYAWGSTWGTALAHMVTISTPWVVLSLVLLTAAILHKLPRWTGPVRIKFASWPIINIVQAHQLSHMVASVATLVQAGASFGAAMRSVAQEGHHRHMRWCAQRAVQALTHGCGPLRSLRSTNLLPRSMLVRIAPQQRRRGCDDLACWVHLATTDHHWLVHHCQRAALHTLLAVLAPLGLLALVLTLVRLQLL